jgi:hypothetical protein
MRACAESFRKRHSLGRYYAPVSSGSRRGVLEAAGQCPSSRQLAGDGENAFSAPSVNRNAVPLSRVHLIALLFDLEAAHLTTPIPINSALPRILVLPCSYLLPIKPGQERENNWTKVLRDTLASSYGQPSIVREETFARLRKASLPAKNGRNGAPGHSPSSFSLTASLTALSI